MKLVFTVLLFCLPPARAANLTLAQFQKAIQGQLAKLDPQTRAGVKISVLGSQKDVFDNDSDSPYIAASASKLITTIGAFETLGRGYTYQTVALAKAGGLILRGNGDPSLDDAHLTLLAQQIATALGPIRTVSSIQIDNSAWAKDYDGLEQFAGFDSEIDAPAVSATSLDDNIIFINFTPQPAQNAPSYDVGPHHNAYAIVQNLVTQVDGNGNDLHIRSLGMTGNQETFEVTGTIGKQSLRLWRACCAIKGFKSISILAASASCPSREERCSPARSVIRSYRLPPLT